VEKLPGVPQADKLCKADQRLDDLSNFLYSNGDATNTICFRQSTDCADDNSAINEQTSNGVFYRQRINCMPLSDDGFSVEQIREPWRSHNAIMTQTQLPLTFSPNCHNCRRLVEMDRWPHWAGVESQYRCSYTRHPVPSALATASCPAPSQLVIGATASFFPYPQSCCSACVYTRCKKAIAKTINGCLNRGM